MITHPQRFFSILALMKRLSLLKPALARFSEKQMGTENNRLGVYYSWVVLRHLAFDMKTLGNLINSHSIALTIIVGKYDPIIRPEDMRRLTARVKDHQLVVAETGHNGVIAASLPYLSLR